MSLGFDTLFQGQNLPESGQVQLDSHFLETDHAEQQNVLAILTECQSLRRTFGGFAVPPDERVRVH